MTYKYLLLTLFLSVFLTACGSSSSSDPAPEQPGGETPDPNDNDEPDDDDDTNGDDDTANGDDDEATTAAGLVAHYMFDNNLEDATGNFGEGQIAGNAPDSEAGAITYASGAVDGSTAAVFDGTSGVNLGESLIGPGDYTLSIWLHPDEIGQFVPAFFGQAGPNSWVSLVPAGPGDDQNTMLWAGDGDGTGWFDGTIGSQIPVGGWSHLVFTYSAGELNAYLNGELAEEHSGFPNVFSNEGASFHLAINPFPDAPYTGLIDDLRIYDVALTAEQVAALNAGEEVVIDEDQISDDDDDGANGDDDDANGDDDGANGDDDGANGDDDDGANGDDDGAGGDDEDGANGDEEDSIAAITGLSAHYAFNNDLSDSTGNNTDDAVASEDSPWELEGGVVTYDGNGVGGGTALALDGTSGVRLPNNLITSASFTISLWINPSELTDWTSALFAEELDLGRWFTLTPKTVDNEVMLRAAYFDDSNGEDRLVFSNIPESTGLSTNEWNHLSITLNGSQMRLYIDGELRGSADDFHPLFADSQDIIFALGVNPFPDTPFQGLMDQLRIYDRALEAEEIVILSAEND